MRKTFIDDDKHDHASGFLADFATIIHVKKHLQMCNISTRYFTLQKYIFS